MSNSDLGSGMDDGNFPSGSGMDNGSFSCRDSSMVSSASISNDTFWKIAKSNHIGATIAGSLVLLFFVVGFVWNLFIVITYLVKHHLLKEAGNVFLFNVAVIDSLMCVTTMTFAYVTAFSGEFVFGDTDKIRCIMCDVSGFFLSFLVLATVHLLSALSVDRFIVLSKPLRYKQIMNHWKAWLTCAFIYILCFILSLLPLMGFGEIEFNRSFGSCVPRFSGTGNLYYVIFVAIEMCIPAIILAVTNVWTFRLVSRFLQRNFLRKSAYQRKDRKEKKKTEVSKHQKQQVQLVKVFGAMFVANIFSYTPTIVLAFTAFALNYASEGSIVPHPEVYTFAYVCFLSNPVFHPIIESSFVKDLRYEISRATKGIHRASTVIYRRTTLLMFSKSLEEASTNMEEVVLPSSESSKEHKSIDACSDMKPAPGCSNSTQNHVSISGSSGLGSSLGSVGDQQALLGDILGKAKDTTPFEDGRDLPVVPTKSPTPPDPQQQGRILQTHIIQVDCLEETKN